MRISICLIAVCIFLLSTSAIKFNRVGKAGATGSPGEQTCSGGTGPNACHGGGFSATKGVTVSATPSFSNDTYYPDTVYSVSVSVNAAGFSRFGFACEVLNSSNVNSGTLQLPGPGVQQINLPRRNMTHTTSGTVQSTFTFQWKAPAAGDGNATFYVCANAVNSSSTTTGDLPIPASLTLTEAVVQPSVDTTGIESIKGDLATHIQLYPQPAKGMTHISYSMRSAGPIKIQLCDLNGRLVKTLLEEFQTGGEQARLLDIAHIPAGVYFVKVYSSANRLSGQKLLVVN